MVIRTNTTSSKKNLYKIIQSYKRSNYTVFVHATLWTDHKQKYINDKHYKTRLSLSVIDT